MNEAVSQFIKTQNHPLEEEINMLRQQILAANKGLSENIKWNGPNYTFNGADRITMRIHPPRQLQVIFHRGAKVLNELKEKLIQDDSGLLTWKTADRAILIFKNKEAITSNKEALTNIVNAWIKATQEM